MWGKAFWKATAERVIRTTAQSEVALLIADGTGILNTDWVGSLSTSGMAGLLALLLCVAAGAASPGTGPSLGTETPTPPA